MQHPELAQHYAELFICKNMHLSFDGTRDSLIPAIKSFSKNYNISEIYHFADLVIQALNPPWVYKLFHCYDIGDQSVYFTYGKCSPLAHDLAVYIQFKCETLFDDSIALSNKTVADFLVAHGAIIIDKPSRTDLEIDMYFDREKRCGEWYLNNYDKFDERYGVHAESFLRSDEPTMKEVETLKYDT